MSNISNPHECLLNNNLLCKKLYLNLLQAKKISLDINISLEKMMINLPMISSNISFDVDTNDFCKIEYIYKNHSMKKEHVFPIVFSVEKNYSNKFKIDLCKTQSNNSSKRFFIYDLENEEIQYFNASIDNYQSNSFEPINTVFNYFYNIEGRLINMQNMIELIHHEIITYYLSNVKTVF